MKKSLIALAVLASSGAAMAQSSVTLFGIVDTGIGYVNKSNAAGDSKYGMYTSGNYTSRIGFRGVEDLGGGLKAGFWLEGELFADDGNASGFNFKRRSTVSLSGGFGEVRLGRDLTPGYAKTSSYDLFNQTGIGQFMGWSNWYGTAGDANGIRSNNMLAYYSPNMGGFTAALGYGFDEQTSGHAGRYIGGNVAYDNGPLSVALSYDDRDSVLAGRDRNAVTLGASYNLNVVKLNAILQQTRDKIDGAPNQKVNAYMLGASAPLGAGEIKAQYTLYDQKAFDDGKSHQLSLGYVYNMSKRTAVYGTVSYLKNKDGANLGLASKNLNTDGPGAGKSQAGVQVGIRHSF
ncbi:porin [Diaphorobacter ruginosibacter]|uniref:porin n=1 Tax=Diaphorobacter ruginosibacter TaxID=1715720 RepID=UPI0033421199